MLGSAASSAYACARQLPPYARSVERTSLGQYQTSQRKRVGRYLDARHSSGLDLSRKEDLYAVSVPDIALQRRRPVGRVLPAEAAPWRTRSRAAIRYVSTGHRIASA
eukprot:1099348-Rhodomonas_salina.3